jgi:hypothetical protein
MGSRSRVSTDTKRRTTLLVVTPTVVAVVAGVIVVVELTSRGSGTDTAE